MPWKCRLMATSLKVETYAYDSEFHKEKLDIAAALTAAPMPGESEVSTDPDPV